MEPTIFKPRLKFKPPLKFGHRLFIFLESIHDNLILKIISPPPTTLKGMFVGRKWFKDFIRWIREDQWFLGGKLMNFWVKSIFKVEKLAFRFLFSPSPLKTISNTPGGGVLKNKSTLPVYWVDGEEGGPAPPPQV